MVTSSVVVPPECLGAALVETTDTSPATGEAITEPVTTVDLARQVAPLFG